MDLNKMECVIITNSPIGQLGVFDLQDKKIEGVKNLLINIPRDDVISTTVWFEDGTAKVYLVSEIRIKPTSHFIKKGGALI